MNKLNNAAFTTTVPKLENVTEQYRFISTSEFIKDVESFGYTLVDTKAPRSGLGMHSMSFSHPSIPNAAGIDLRLLATNSHDGSSAFRLYVQMLVQVCSNGLVAWQSDAATASRVVHKGYAKQRAEAALAATRARFNTTLDTIDSLKDIQALPEQSAAFLLKAAALRDAKPYKLIDLAIARHSEQRENTAWNVFNRVQESLMKGGYRTAETINSQTFPGNRARAVTAIKDSVRINTRLWELTVETFLNKA